MSEIKLVVSNELGKIAVNYEEIKQLLEGKLKEYKGIIFTEDSVDIAKKEKASLNNLKKDLSDRRILVKKEYMKPIDEFEDKIKKLSAMIDEPILEISTQLDVFEQKRIDSKKAEIKTIYEESILDMGKYITLDKIYNKKWENATFKVNKIREEIEEAVASTIQAVNTIKSMNSDSVDKALELYKENLSLSDAISYVNRYETIKSEALQKEQERRRLEEIERVKKEERLKMQAEADAIKKEQEIKEVAKAEAVAETIEMLISEPESESELALYEYRLQLGEESKRKLEIYLDTAGIEWEVL